MTLKQFGYLCGGGILAIISYKLPLPFFFTWPLTLGFAFLGVGFAFIPVEERPMDVWVFSFFKSIYNPTQYVWNKETAKTPEKTLPAKSAAASVPPTTPVTVQQTAPPQPATSIASQAPRAPHKAILSGIFGGAPVAPTPAATPAIKPQVITMHPQKSLLEGVFSFFAPKPKPSVPAASAPLRQPPSVTGYKLPELVPEEHKKPAPSQETIATQRKMTELEESLKGLQAQLTTKTVTEDRILELQKQLTEVLKEKSKMEDELTHLKRRFEAPSAPPVPPKPQTSPQGEASSPQPTVNVISSQDAATKVGLPRLTNVANVITGLIKDDAGNMLPGILVTVTNTEGIPMRAFKTNKLGQFGASTPLPNDTYLVEIEDPRDRFTFDRAQITLNGVVLPALEIIAKSQKRLIREKLAQEIFGGKVQ